MGVERNREIPIQEMNGKGTCCGVSGLLTKRGRALSNGLRTREDGEVMRGLGVVDGGKRSKAAVRVWDGAVGYDVGEENAVITSPKGGKKDARSPATGARVGMRSL